MEFLWILLVTLTAHMVGDYLFQTEYLARNKGSSNYILLAHCVLYTFGVFFTGLIIYEIRLSFLALVILLISHIIIDYIKARGISTKYIGEEKALFLDQTLHYLVLLSIYCFSGVI